MESMRCFTAIELSHHYYSSTRSSLSSSLEHTTLSLRLGLCPMPYIWNCKLQSACCMSGATGTLDSTECKMQVWNICRGDGRTCLSVPKPTTSVIGRWAIWQWLFYQCYVSCQYFKTRLPIMQRTAYVYRGTTIPNARRRLCRITNQRTTRDFCKLYHHTTATTELHIITVGLDRKNDVIPMIYHVTIM